MSLAAVMLLAVKSRLVFVTACILAHILIPDHKAEGVYVWQQQYYEAPNSTVTGFASLLQAFTRWDSARFLGIAEHGYQNEETFAFFPMFPFFIRTTKEVFLDKIAPTLAPPDSLVIAGLLVSNVSFLVAVATLYLFVRDVLHASDGFVSRCCYIFCWNPASVFMVTVYTESSFAALTLVGLYTWFMGARAKSVLISWTYQLISGMLFMMATTLRSNGILNISVILWDGVLGILSICDTKEKSRSFIALRVIILVIKTTAWCVIVMIPYFWFQQYAEMRLCGTSASHHTLFSFPERSLNADWIQSASLGVLSFDTIPHATWCEHRESISLYKYIQGNYWNVGFLRYYQIKQVPNFVLAAPIIGISFWGIQKYLKFWFQQLFARDIWVVATKVQHAWRTAKPPGEHSFALFPLVCTWAFLLTFAVLTINVQVTTRLLLASTPCIVISMAAFEEQYPNSHCIRNYLVLYNVLGIIMHPNFLPWT
eukprot:m.342767 g.342767  ORF g.342767 m.342767 type:complete len:482 (+) comp21816_c0_seq1:146-1591(+)